MPTSFAYTWLPTAWTSEWPLVNGSLEEALSYPTYIQLYLAFRQRSWDFNGRDSYFPGNLHIWEKGLITGIVDNDDGTTTITSSGKNWFLAAAACKDPFQDSTSVGSCSTSTPGYAPTTWDVGISSPDQDPRKSAHWTLASWTTDTLTVNGRAMDLVKSKQVSALTDLVGFTFDIFGAGEPYWSDQWPDCPNDHRLDFGTIETGTTTTIRVYGKNIPTDKWKTKELMCRDTTGRYLRLTITGSSTDTTVTPHRAVFTFAATTNVPTGDFAIVEPGALFVLGKEVHEPGGWYYGLMDSTYSHTPIDTVGTAPTVKVFSAPVEEGYDPCDDVAMTQPRYIYDEDYWTLADNGCGPANSSLNGRVPKSFRWLQRIWEGFAPLYSDGVQHGDGPNAFFNYAVALAFQDWGAVTWGGTTGTLVGGSLPTGLTAHYLPIDGYYAILDADGAVLTQGWGTINTSNQLTPGALPPDIVGAPPFTTDHQGRTIIFAPGWSRFLERQVNRIYRIRRWIPDADPDAAGPGISYITTPREPLPTETEGPGHWEVLDPSTHACGPDIYGRVLDSTLDIDLFADGHIARYRAQDFYLPSTLWQPGSDPSTLVRATIEDRAYWGHLSKANQAKRDSTKSGMSKDFSTGHITHKDRNWFDCTGYVTGLLVTLSGSDSISGGSVTLISKSTSTFFTAPSQWAVEQTIEGYGGLDMDGNEIWFPRFITAQTGNALTLNETMPASTAWRIRVPNAGPNMWWGRTVFITPLFADGTSGTKIVTTLLGNSTDTLFFPAITLPGGTVAVTYAIDEMPMHGVVKRVSGKWVRTAHSMSDAVRLDVPVPTNFHNSTWDNLPDTIRRYGRWLYGDHVVEVENQLYLAINLLMKHVRLPSFTEYASRAAQLAVTPDANFKTSDDATVYFCDGTDAGMTTIRSDADTRYGAATATTVSAPTPFKAAGQTVEDSCEANYSAEYAFPSYTVVASSFSRTAKFYIRCGVGAGDPLPTSLEDPTVWSTWFTTAKVCSTGQLFQCYDTTNCVTSSDPPPTITFPDGAFPGINVMQKTEFNSLGYAYAAYHAWTQPVTGSASGTDTYLWGGQIGDLGGTHWGTVHDLWQCNFYYNSINNGANFVQGVDVEGWYVLQLVAIETVGFTFHG